jgi:hypothetical protein
MRKFKPTNKQKAVYLLWVVLQLVALFWPKGRELFEIKGNYFYPFVFDLRIWAYDITEFIFYLTAPILIYYAVTLLRSKE